MKFSVVILILIEWLICPNFFKTLYKVSNFADGKGGKLDFDHHFAFRLTS